MTTELLTVFFATAIAGAVPLLWAAVGETVSQQSGVLNVGLEGTMLVGAYAAFVGVLTTGNFWVGFAAGMFAGLLAASIMVALSVRLAVNQIVVGIGITLVGTGVTSMLYDAYYASTAPRLGLAPEWAIPVLSQLPVVGPVLFSQPGMFTLSFVATALTSVWLHRTAPGLKLRAAGQSPSALTAAGGNVMRTRTLAVLFGGAMAGLGGAYLALISAGSFTPHMTQGLGFLAIVVAMLGRGRMLLVLLISLGYGLLVALGTAAQLVGVNLPSDIIQMVPFVAVLLVLALLPSAKLNASRFAA